MVRNSPFAIRYFIKEGGLIFEGGPIFRRLQYYKCYCNGTVEVINIRRIYIFNFMRSRPMTC